MKKIAAGRISADHYQIMITDSIDREIDPENNWDKEKSKRGYAGDRHTLLVGTEADQNDHWVTVFMVNDPPDFGGYERVLSLPFRCDTGKMYIVSVTEFEPALEIKLEPGPYSIYVAGKNLGIDQLSLGEDSELTDVEIENRADVERYDLFIASGLPAKAGTIIDQVSRIENDD